MAANVAVYAALAAAVLTFGPALRFSWERIPEYLRGEIDASEQRYWELDAEWILEEGGDLAEARALLERAIAAEPSGSTYYLLGEVDRAEGRQREALRDYERSCELDPAQSEAWLRAAEQARVLGDPGAADRLLERGERKLERLVAAHVPVVDRTADGDANEKAREVHAALTRHLELVRAARRSPAS